jgi:predicted nuclease of predicted toxin-antitoxin system
MRFLFDQNISHRILQHLPDSFSGSSSVKGEGLINSTDREIWDFAEKLDYIIVTQDSDFNDLNSILGFPPKVIWVRTGNLRTKKIVDILVEYTSEIERFLANDQYGCLEIVSFKK